jgi:hypothetical protein
MIKSTWVNGLYNARRDGRLDDDELTAISAEWDASPIGLDDLYWILFGDSDEWLNHSVTDGAPVLSAKRPPAQ